ncbi:MAG: hypothetical protein CL609_09420 [Anaerolineaceae bacterium]|nr:hypothetical protein [Anaerolineaceae bacterium]
MTDAGLRILNAEPDSYCKEAEAILRSLGSVDFKSLNREQLLNCIADYDVLIVRLGFQINREVFLKAKKLKTIVTATTGLDHIDLAAAKEFGVTVLSLRGEVDFLRSIPATAELTWGLLLNITRNLPQAYFSVLNGRWDREAFRGFDLAGKKLGILGLGRIGEKIARYGLAFDMQVRMFDIDKTKTAPGVKSMDTMQDLFAWADIISIHVPLNETTQNLVGMNELSQMENGYLINTARGDVLNEQDLILALEKGHLRGAAVDVIQDERGLENNPSPLINYAKSHSNLIITPHIGGASFDSMASTEIFMANKLKNHLDFKKGEG